MYPCPMGLSCSKSEGRKDVLRNCAKALSRGQMAQSLSLADLCINTLADHHQRLRAVNIEEHLGSDLAQRLLNALICRRQLGREVAALFARCFIWSVCLPRFSGVDHSFVQLLSSGSLTIVDLSGTDVRSTACSDRRNIRSVPDVQSMALHRLSCAAICPRS